MKYEIKHSIRGRVRIHLDQNRMTYTQADTFQYYLQQYDCVTEVKVYERTSDAVICYTGERKRILAIIRAFSYESVSAPEDYLSSSGREVNSVYFEKLVMKIVIRYAKKLFLPMPVRTVITVIKSIKYIFKGIKSLLKLKLEVPVLDALAIGVSIFRGNFTTASSVMFLLDIGELLEEWTHKKSVVDLAKAMSIRSEKVWKVTDGRETLVKPDEINAGDIVMVHAGSVIPFDGKVLQGEAMVNQASMTGEPLPVNKHADSYVYAGTALDEGELTIQVKEAAGSTRYEKIVTMIEDTQKLKSASESKAEHLADRLVPYTLAGTALTYLLTRNVTKAVAVLMVDFSCALKLAMPVTVLSAIREAGEHHIVVKGGKYLEAVAEAKTLVFDKTGTLTKATPVVRDIVTFNGMDKNEALRIAACLEEHFPHSMAKAVVDAARDRNLEHDEMHSKVNYIVAHGISSTINGKSVVLGSSHFIFEDEGCTVPDDEMTKFKEIPSEYSQLYLALESKLIAVICIEDPLRDEVPEVIEALRAEGIEKLVIMTGDNEKTARAIAARAGVDEYHAEVLPEDKAKFIELEKQNGSKVIMIGDGINDSPALSAADVGIAISDGAEIAREVADITINAESLKELVMLRTISNRLMRRIKKNYTSIVSINTGLIILSILGILTPSASALLHNISTIGITLESMKDLVKEESENDIG